MTIKGKDLLEQIKDKEFNQDILAELEKYEVKRPKTACDINYGDDYYTLDFEKSEWECRLDNWWGLSGERRNKALGLIHLTKERAEEHARVLNTELAIKKWKRENDNVELDWQNGNQSKNHFMYYFKSEKIDIGLMFKAKLANTIYFSSKSKIQQCINDIGEERIIEWIKWEDNDQ